jgi:transcriptional/translational regulatory protein YebC/TACO1
MAGHSKWAQIKRAKGVTDAARSRVFARFARLIALESKKTGGSVSSPSLAAVITRAKAANMPKDNIERAVAKGTSKDAGDLEEVTYECYGPGACAIVINALTDKKNRTTQELKILLQDRNFELASPGAATWAFTRKPDGSYVPNEPLMEVSGTDEEQLGSLLEALDAQDDVQAVFTNARGYESTAEESA